MNTKRLVKWVIVLFLFAALPGMTAVMAQDEARETLTNSFACNVKETEPNGGRASANAISTNDVVCGDYSGGVDYPEHGEATDWYRFHLSSPGYVVIEMTSGEFASNVNYWLEDSTGKVLSFIYRDYGVYGALLFENLYKGDYFIGVSFNKSGSSYGQPHWIKYSLAISSPLLVSAGAGGLANGGTVAGIHFFSEDILAHSDLNNGEQRWRMFLRGSGAGIRTPTIAIAVGGPGNNRVDDGDEILITTASKPYDIYRYDPSGPCDCLGYNPPYGYGSLTGGTLTLILEGAMHGLTTASEKLDAIDGWIFGYEADPLRHGCFGYPVSTVGNALVNTSMKQNDEDVFCKVFDDRPGYGWGRWDWFFDVAGASNAPLTEPRPGKIAGLPSEDVYAMAYDDADDVMYLTIQGTGTIFGNNVSQKDIFAINYPAYTWGGIVWHGPDHGWNYNIDAIEWNGP